MTGGKLPELEAVRGVAALVVVVFHVLLAFRPAVLEGRGPLAVGGWVSGPPAVRVFFVLSGLVLTLKFFAAGDVRVLTSGAVRRYPRLLPPIAAAVALGYAVQAGGLTANARAAAVRPPQGGEAGWLGAWYREPASAGWAVREAVYQTLFDHRRDRTLNNALWTMSVEFGGSLFVFGLAAAAGRRRRRGLVYAAVAAVLLAGRQFFLLDFLCGLVLADRLAAGRPAPGWWAVPLLPAGLLAGTAGGLERHLGGPLVVAGVVFAPAWAAALRAGPLVWLGRVSFCLYLFHIPVLFSAGCEVYCRVIDAGHGPPAAAWAGGAVTLAGSLGLAHLGAATVDAGAIRLARWVDRVAFPPAGPEAPP